MWLLFGQLLEIFGLLFILVSVTLIANHVTIFNQQEGFISALHFNAILKFVLMTAPWGFLL